MAAAHTAVVRAITLQPAKFRVMCVDSWWQARLSSDNTGSRLSARRGRIGSAFGFHDQLACARVCLTDNQEVTALPLLELVHATVMKRGRKALDDVSLTIASGQHAAIVGPNGAGKSTLVNLLTLVDRPMPAEDGRPAVRVFGRDLWNVTDLRRTLGVVSADLQQRFVNGNVAGPIVAADAVISGLLATHGWVPDADVTEPMRRQAARALTRLGIGDLAQVRLDEMSTGEARRVLIARALVHEPRVLVLDEPTAGLDIVARRHFLEHIREVARSGTTIVTITHRLDEVIPEVEHVVLLRRGRVEMAGPRAQVLTSEWLTRVFETPVTLREADGFVSASVAAG